MPLKLSPRLKQIDELNRAGLTPEEEAERLALPLKTVREYQYRLHQRLGEVRPRGAPGHTRSIEEVRELGRCGREAEACRKAAADPALTPSQRAGALQGEADWLLAASMAAQAKGLNGGRKELNMSQEREQNLKEMVNRVAEGEPADAYDIHRIPSRDGGFLRETLAGRHAELRDETHDVVAFSSVETAAALNYWRGRAEEYNATREAIARQHPELAKDLPPALEVDEIRVRQVSLEREQEQDRGLAVAR